MTSPRRASSAPISPAVPPSPTHSPCLLDCFWLRVSFSPSPRLPLLREAVDLCDRTLFFSNYTRTHLNGKRFLALFPSLLVIWQVLENPVINNLCRKTDDVLRSQKVIFSRTQLFEHFPDAPRQSSPRLTISAGFPARASRQAGRTAPHCHFCSMALAPTAVIPGFRKFSNHWTGSSTAH